MHAGVLKFPVNHRQLETGFFFFGSVSDDSLELLGWLTAKNLADVMGDLKELGVTSLYSLCDLKQADLGKCVYLCIYSQMHRTWAKDLS